MMTATKSPTYVGTFQESIAGAVLVKVTRNGRRIDIDTLPAGVAEYLCVKKTNAGTWVFDGGDFDKLVSSTDQVAEKKRGKKTAPRQATATFTVEPHSVEQTEPAEQLPVTWGDGSKWGVSDWYETLEAAITAALARGKGYAWTTGWYGSKKEIASACVSQRDGEITVRVSVSDDFDTDGNGERAIRFTKNLDRIREALDGAYADARRDRRDNEAYAGFSVGRGDKWEFTLILPQGWGHESDAPPGDNYHRWGWQEVEDGEDRPSEIPADVAERMKQWAEDTMHEAGMKHTVGEWTIKAWEDDSDT